MLKTDSVPVVTVGIPTRNRPESLRRALASVICQTYSSWRVLVWDNGNLEANCEVVRSFSDNRLEYVGRQSEAGVVPNFNYILANARSPYCAILHDDDQYRRDYLQTMISAMEAYPSAGWAFCDAVWGGHTASCEDPHTFAVPKAATPILLSPGPSTALRVFSGELRVPCPSALFRGEVAAKERFDDRYPIACDVDLFVRLAGRYPGVYVPRALFHYCPGRETASFRALGSGQLIIDIARIGAKLSSDDSLRSVQREVARVTDERVRTLCLGLLKSPHMVPDPAQYVSSREALRNHHGLVAAATRTILGHRRLIRATLLLQRTMRSLKRVLIRSRYGGR
jgi:glycosyltransferase involved in cell wall biosynthesis